MERENDIMEVEVKEGQTIEIEIEEPDTPAPLPWKDGKDGNNGRDGVNGKDGKPGKDGRDGVDGKDWRDGKDGKDWKDGQDGNDWKDGENGKSAYDIAVENGFTGTLEEWVQSLKWKDGKNGRDWKDGAPGRPGTDGPRGVWVMGPAGPSAYQIAVNNGFVGTEQEWLDSLGGVGVNKNYFDFDTTPTGIPTAEGVLSWNETEKTLDLQQGNGVIQQIGQEQYWRGKNQTGDTITNASIVFANGALGASGIMTIDKYIADGSIAAMYVLGITTEDILDGGDWFITTFGKIRGIDTTGGAENWQEGDVLYASTTTPGSLTNVEPAFPMKRIPIAFVISRHAVNGTIAVRVPTPDQTADEVGYDNTTSGLTATNVKAAIDEVAGKVEVSVGETNTLTGTGLWLQTGLWDGSDFTLWFEDGL